MHIKVAQADFNRFLKYIILGKNGFQKGLKTGPGPIISRVESGNRSLLYTFL